MDGPKVAPFALTYHQKMTGELGFVKEESIGSGTHLASKEYSVSNLPTKRKKLYTKLVLYGTREISRNSCWRWKTSTSTQR